MHFMNNNNTTTKRKHTYAHALVSASHLLRVNHKICLIVGYRKKCHQVYCVCVCVPQIMSKHRTSD